MKRFLALLLLFVLCFSHTVSQAEEQEEYTFQGIPWFSSPEDTVQMLYEKGFIDKKEAYKANDNHIKVIYQLKTKGKSRIKHDENDTACPYSLILNVGPLLSEKLQVLRYRKKLIKKTIAQQEFDLSLFYTSDPKNPQLVECDLDFISNDYDTEALYQALVAAYGEATAAKKYDEKIWIGANNTIIILNDFQIAYATIDGLALAESYDLPTEEKEDTGF